jgi:GTP cyclohydrolase I
MAPSQKKLTKAVASFVEALGYPLKGELKNTPERVASLWTEHLLWGASYDIESVFKNLSKTHSHDPVAVVDMGIHMVCPHHLTVATGVAHIAYIPNMHVCGFGSLSQLAKACTARIVLQEDATAMMADVLNRFVQPLAVVACIEAQHPCHTLLHPRSHQARCITWHTEGNASQCRILKQHIKDSRT